MASAAHVSLRLIVLAVGLRAVPAVARASEDCLSCLCQAATGCDVNRDCDAGGTCGMFAVSQQYWLDAGAPAGDFETCALDPACATQCVQVYMQKFLRDCDGDGEVSCDDMYRLHHLGRQGCGGQLDGAFAGRLASCNASIPLGDFYARAVDRPARQGWRGGGRGSAQSWEGNSFPQSWESPIPTGSGVNFSPSISTSRSTVTQNGGYTTGGEPAVYRAGVYSGLYTTGYQEDGYRTSSGSGYRHGTPTGPSNPGGYRGALWGAGESGGYSGLGSISARVGNTRRSGGALTRPVSQSCLSCICNALTGCNSVAACDNGGCGAFKMSYVFWQDCGAPGSSYQHCTRDYECSSHCTQTYLTKYAQDCNGDGVINCNDYVRIHRLGAFGCQGQLDELFRSRTETCTGY